MNSQRILNSTKYQVGPKKNRLMYVKISIEQHKLNTLVNIGASDVVISEEAPTEFGLKLEKNKRWFKTVNSNKISTVGLA